MHYGTFRLSHEPIEEPLQLLEREAQKAGVKDKVVVLEEGITRFFDLTNLTANSVGFVDRGLQDPIIQVVLPAMSCI